MTEATIRVETLYVNPDELPNFAGDFPSLPAPALTIVKSQRHALAPYTQFSQVGALLEDGASAGDGFDVDLGDIATEVTGFVLKNTTSQELGVAINGVDASGGGALSGAVATEATKVGDLETVLVAQFVILDAFTGASSAATIVAAIATAKAALAPKRTALTTATSALVAADGSSGDAIFTMPPGAVLAYSTPAAADTPITSITLNATATQTGDEPIECLVFGDP